MFSSAYVACSAYIAYIASLAYFALRLLSLSIYNLLLDHPFLFIYCSCTVYKTCTYLPQDDT